MAQLCGVSIQTESNEIDGSIELDYVPFSLRRRLLLSTNLSFCSSLTTSTDQKKKVLTKKKDESCDSQVDCGVADKGLENAIACQELAMSGDCDSHKTELHGNFCSDQIYVEGNSVNADTGAVKLESNISNESNDFADNLDHIVLKLRRRLLIPSKLVTIERPILEDSSDTTNDVTASRNNTSGSTVYNLVEVKAEPLDNSKLQNAGKNAMGNPSLNVVSVKSEPDYSDELNRDEVDDMQLQLRMTLQAPRKYSKSNSSENFERLGKVLPSTVENGPATMESSNQFRIFLPRKRKKTLTDSIETALEEDAPGLLQVLIEQGVSIDEMKLYGETDDEEPIDESFIEDGFAELEAVISKIFFHQSSLLKFATLKCAKGSKPSYCLGCLFSLVEQARYLRFRNWPAEWGWCRDLQAFIFVFERHKRIVLERPEYGYATYFFELVESSPIDWQVKRLVTSMKLTSCGRINLIENKTLVVGEDLTEGEAEVLMRFGWTPNSGLGTMLNYRERVFHDRRNEKDSSEWRSKIGKLLMDGLNGGTIVSSVIQAKVTESGADETPQIKTEL